MSLILPICIEILRKPYIFEAYVCAFYCAHKNSVHCFVVYRYIKADIFFCIKMGFAENKKFRLSSQVVEKQGYTSQNSGSNRSDSGNNIPVHFLQAPFSSECLSSISHSTTVSGLAPLTSPRADGILRPGAKHTQKPAVAIPTESGIFLFLISSFGQGGATRKDARMTGFMCLTPCPPYGLKQSDGGYHSQPGGDTMSYLDPHAARCRKQFSFVTARLKNERVVSANYFNIPNSSTISGIDAFAELLNKTATGMEPPPFPELIQGLSDAMKRHDAAALAFAKCMQAVFVAYARSGEATAWLPVMRELMKINRRDRHV